VAFSTAAFLFDMASFFHDPNSQQQGVRQKSTRICCPFCPAWYNMDVRQEVLTSHVKETHPVQWQEYLAWQVDLQHLDRMFLMEDKR
jgi:hypothetical protein